MFQTKPASVEPTPAAEKADQGHRAKPLDIERAAWFLSRRYGDDCALVAYRRALACAQSGRRKHEAEWRQVMRRLIDVHFAIDKRPLH